MRRRGGVLSDKPAAFFLSPEAPYPAWGGGALRSASLIEYLAQRYTVDAVVCHETGSPHPAGFPPGMAREVHMLALPFHARGALARAMRNAGRLLRNTPPLFDRFSGLDSGLAGILGERRYELAVIEHFWCASYAGLLRARCATLVLDLHNIESRLHATTADSSRGPAAFAFRKFAKAYQKLERDLLPRFDRILVPSDDDRELIGRLVPPERLIVYPNALPSLPLPIVAERDAIVFSGNLEYHPNRDAVRHFHRAVWPLVAARWPDLEWWLVGKNPHGVAPEVAGDPHIRLIGPVDDAVSELAAARVCVVPVLAGSGTRFKILEAWAAARAVVSTTLGAEGLGAKDGEHLLLADDVPSFARAITRLLESPELRQRLGKAGRALYLERFTWESAWQRLEQAGI